MAETETYFTKREQLSVPSCEAHPQGHFRLGSGITANRSSVPEL